MIKKKCPQCLISPLIHLVIQEIRKACKKDPTACGFNISDNAYEPLKLMQAVMARTNEICLRYLDNSMLCSLPPPGLPHNITSVCAMKNKRRRMEDRHVVIHDLNTMFSIQEASPSSYYAIFDGHAGHDAAAYSSAHLHQYLAESQYFYNNPKEALYDAFRRTDDLFINKCKVESFSSGTTAVCALLRPKEKILYIAWVGDSQAVLVKQGKILECVIPHKPSRPDEKTRIQEAGGYVNFWGTWRVNGQLAVSRAIGDLEYKPSVIAVPDIQEIPLDGCEDFLILACDGLWDYVSEDDATTTVYNMVCQDPENSEQVSERLVQLSKDQGSTDNISVIVVFLRDPSKVAADAQTRATRTTTTMDTMDNANNPFTMNGTNNDNNILHSDTTPTDGLLLNLTENLKQQNGSGNGGITPQEPNNDFHLFTGNQSIEKSNGKRSADFDDVINDDDDDFGPETDVDTIDDVVVSPSILAAKALAEGIVVNNNPPPISDDILISGFNNPFVVENKELEKQQEQDNDELLEFDLQKQQDREFDGERSPREETPTPPVDTMHDGGLIDNVADSGEDSEDEWNYIKGEEANKENIEPATETEINLGGEGNPEGEEEDDNMSQLNPNAAEFVPVSPTRSIPSPICRALIDDAVIAQSPKRPTEIDINLPNAQDFEEEVKSRPSDFDASYSNGHAENEEQQDKEAAVMENILNGKNIDEIPEFQPSPVKTTTGGLTDEFHFGPNAAPFSPTSKPLLDETAASTKANFGDDTNVLLDNSFDSSPIDDDQCPIISRPKESDDPMSMSFYQDKGAGGDNDDNNSVDPFTDDLNKVQVLPDNLEEFLDVKSSPPAPLQSQKDENEFNDTISDLPEHDPLSDLLNNDERVQTTDLDKNNEEEKELASPSTPSIVDDLLSGICELPKSPQPVEQEQEQKVDDKIEEVKDLVENLPDVCVTTQSEAIITQSNVDELLQPLQPEVVSPEPELICDLDDTKQQPIIESPSIDEITSSVKDLASPPQVISPVPDVVDRTEPIEIPSSPIRDEFGLPDNNCLISTPKSLAATETESVATTDVNSFLERSDIVDITSPLSPTNEQQLLIDENSSPAPIDNNKTESILADATVTTPIDLIEETLKVEEIQEKEVVEEKKELEAVAGAGVAVAVAAAAATAAVTATKVAEKSSSPPTKTSKSTPTATKKTAPGATATKKPTTVSSPTKPKPPIAAAAAKPRVGSSAAKPAPTKTSTNGAVPKTTFTARPAPKPRTTTTTTTTKSTTEKKSLTNGDVKPSATAAKKIDVKTTTATTRTLTARPSPTKPAVSKTTTLNKTTSAAAAAGAKPAVSATGGGAATNRLKSTSLNKTTGTSSARTTTTITKSTVSKTAAATAPLSSRPTTAPAKPRVPLTKTVAKSSSTDTEKQNKESANKLTASRTTTLSSARNTTTTTKRIESKVQSRTNVTKSTTTTTTNAKTTAASNKKTTPQPITKTKTTKIEKPIPNGVSSTVVTEQITIVNNAVNENDLVKDISPVDNKLIVDANVAD